MLTTQLKASFMLLALFLTIAIAAKALGTLQPPNPALRGFIEGCEDKPQPCWYGVVPGETSLEDAKVIWNLDIPHPTSPVTFVELPETGIICNIAVTQPELTFFALWFCENVEVSIGEFFATLGIPDGIGEPPNYELRYGSNSTLFNWKWSLFDRVAAANLSTKFVRHVEWHGFVPLWRYCQLEPHFFSCQT